MPLYKSATTQTVPHGRLAINQMTGVYLSEPHAELEQLVADGILVKEADVPEVVVEAPSAPKAAPAASPVKPTA